MHITPTTTTALVISLACAILLAEVDYCFARDDTAPQSMEAGRVLEMEGMSAWLKARFSQSELEGLRPGELRVEAYYCGCYDYPRKHFPYAAVLLRTPKGDLIARPEGGDEVVRFTALAVRFGNQYCEIESEQRCYGAFSHPCDFTDFRYGPYLAEFFPTCKSDEPEIAASIAFDGMSFGP